MKKNNYSRESRRSRRSRKSGYEVSDDRLDKLLEERVEIALKEKLATAQRKAVNAEIQLGYNERGITEIEWDGIRVQVNDKSRRSLDQKALKQVFIEEFGMDSDEVVEAFDSATNESKFKEVRVVLPKEEK